MFATMGTDDTVESSLNPTMFEVICEARTRLASLPAGKDHSLGELARIVKNLDDGSCANERYSSSEQQGRMIHSRFRPWDGSSAGSSGEAAASPELEWTRRH